MLLHVVKETDAGIVVRGAKFETAAAYANQAFTKPTIANWGNSALSDYAVGFICDFNSPNLKFICRTGFAGRAPKEDYPLANRFDEVDALVIFDNVLIPWENVLFYRHTRAATFIRSTLHRYSAFAFTQRVLKLTDLMIGVALFNVRQTGLDKQQAVQEKLAELAVYREGINAHLTASIALAERSPGGLMMPNQSLLFTGRVLASSQLHHMMHIARELCGGQICVTPDKAAFEAPETKPWLDKYYTVNEGWVSEDRRKLLAFARDLLNSDNAGHRLTFQLFAQSAPFANLAAVYRNFDWDGPLTFVQKSAGLSDKVLAASDRKPFDKAPAQWLAAQASKKPPNSYSAASFVRSAVSGLPGRASPRWSRRVAPAYSVRNSPRRCSSGTTSFTKSCSPPGSVANCIMKPSVAPMVTHCSITSAMCVGVPLMVLRPRS